MAKLNIDIQSFPLRRIAIGDLKRHPENDLYRTTHEQERQNLIKATASVAECGIIHDPVVSQREDGDIYILSGHSRVEALVANGKTLEDTVLCRVLSGLTYQQEYIILTNANRQRTITYTMDQREFHRDIELACVRSKKKKNRKWDDGKPSNLDEAAVKWEMSPSQVRKISASISAIAKEPDPYLKDLAQKALDNGYYEETKRIISKGKLRGNMQAARDVVSALPRRKDFTNMEKLELAYKKIAFLEEENSKLKSEIAKLKNRIAESL